MRNLLTHDPLTGLFTDLTVYKAQNAVVHVQGAAPKQPHSLAVLQAQFQPHFLADVLLLEFEFGR